MLYRFELNLSDVDRGVYESLDLRVAQHPSESLAYLLTRVLAYALNYQEGLEFSHAGLGDPDAPALSKPGVHGGIALWIDIGNPSVRRLHKASKAADQVLIYTYKNVASLVDQVKDGGVHRVADVKVYAIESKFLENLEGHLGKKNSWTVLHQQDRVTIGIGDEMIASDLRRVSLV